MSLILNIETTTKACSVSLAESGKLLSLHETIEESYAHSRLLTVYIEKLFSKTGFKIKQLDAVAVSSGPGSYTGLRIGVSVAKGIAYALDIPIISVNTLQAMAFGISAKLKTEDTNSLFCPMLDARRMEVYAAIFDLQNNCQREIMADIIDKKSYHEFLTQRKVYFFGDGAQKCKEMLTHKNAQFLEGIFPSAQNMIPFSEEKFIEKSFENTAYFEPFYLKEFIASVATKNIYL